MLTRSSTFTPHISLAVPPRPVTSDDLERDRVLSQRIALFGWIEEKHLDVPEGEGSQGFIQFAEQGTHRNFLFAIYDRSLRCTLRAAKD